MKVAALLSGGKDSLHAASLLEQWGWRIEEVLTLVPADSDSLLFHTPNLRWTRLIAEAWGKPYRSAPVEGRGEPAELEGLRRALEPLKEAGFDGVSVGAIASSFQWSRVHRVAGALGLKVFAPLWRVEPERVVREEIAAGFDIRVVRVATEALGPEWLGARLDASLLDRLKTISRDVRELSVAGEGGEYESLVVDAPIFSARIVVDRAHAVSRGPEHTWAIDEAHLEAKGPPS